MAKDMNFIQPDNPTNEERHKMLRMTLEKVNRLEDFDNIIKLLGPPKEITSILNPGSCKDIKVGIIGAGIAGLTSAFELRKLGFNITIFETEKNRIGGRIYTHYFDKDKRYYGELGAMRLPISHESVWHYINLFKLKTRPFIQNNENAFIYIRNKRARNDAQGKSVMENIYPEFKLTPKERNTPWQKLIEYALTSNLYKISPNIRKELLEIKKEYSMTIKYVGRYGIRKVMEKMGLSEGAIELISGIAPFLGCFYYNSYSENLIEEYTLDYAYRYEIEGGFIKLPLASYKSLLSTEPKEYVNIDENSLGKVTFKTGKTIIGIHKFDGLNKVCLEYRDEKTLEIFNENFDFVICSIPFSSLRNVNIDPMFSTEKMQSIKEVFYTSSQKTAFLCRKRFWEEGSANERIIGGGSSTDLPIQTIWYPNHSGNINQKRALENRKSNLNRSAGVLLASYNINLDAIRLGNLDDNDRVYEIKRQVEKVHGLKKGYLDPIVIDYKTVDWNKEKGFYGAFCYFYPEQQQLFSYAMEKPEYENRVYFAGEHVSLTHGWIQGSILSAMNAANSIAEYCKSMI